MVLELEILTEIKNMSGKLDCSRNNLTAINNLLKELIAWRKARYENILAKEYTIALGESYTTSGVNNPGFNRCRLEIATVFVNGLPAAGLGVQMVYGNSPIGKVFDIIASNGSAIMRSEPIDVKELNAFQFEIHNRDSTNAVILRLVKVVLYND